MTNKKNIILTITATTLVLLPIIGFGVAMCIDVYPTAKERYIHEKLQSKFEDHYEFVKQLWFNKVRHEEVINPIVELHKDWDVYRTDLGVPIDKADNCPAFEQVDFQKYIWGVAPSEIQEAQELPNFPEMELWFDTMLKYTFVDMKPGELPYGIFEDTIPDEKDVINIIDTHRGLIFKHANPDNQLHEFDYDVRCYLEMSLTGFMWIYLAEFGEPEIECTNLKLDEYRKGNSYNKKIEISYILNVDGTKYLVEGEFRKREDEFNYEPDVIRYTIYK